MTDFAAILAELGFEGSVVSEQKTTVVVRVWTSKGWAYERFAKDAPLDVVSAWVKGMEPGK